MSSSLVDALNYITDVAQSHPLLMVMVLFYAYMLYQRTRPFPEVPGSKVLSMNDLEDFKGLLKPDAVTIVDFYATWCPPCRAAAPTYGAMSKDEAFSKVQFVKVNVDAARDIARAYKVSSMPTFMLFKGDQVVESVVGWSEARLRSLLAPYSTVPSKHD